MKLLKYLVWVFAIGFCSCDDPDSALLEEGILNVFVKDEFGKPIQDAIIKLTPGEFEGVSNENGVFAFLSLPVGSYQAIASREDFDPSHENAELSAGKSTSLIIILKPANQAPSLDIFSPENEEYFTNESEITFSLLVEDDKRADEVELFFSSDLEGDLGNVRADSDGNVEYSIVLPTIGFHEVTIEAIDAIGASSSISVFLNIEEVIEKVDFKSVSSTSDGVLVLWESSEINGFDKYVVFRSNQINGEYISVAEISEQEVSDFLDETALYGEEYFYKIRLINVQGLFSESVEQNVIFEFEAIDLSGYKITKMFKSPNQNIIYALDANQQVLLLINLLSNKIQKVTQLSHSPTDMAINANAKYLYFALQSAPKIIEVNAITGNVNRTIDLQEQWWSVGEYPYRIGCTSDLEHFVVATARGQINYIQVSNGFSVANLVSCCDESGILTHPQSNFMYFTEFNSSGCRTQKYYRSTSYSNLVQEDRSDGYPNFKGRDFAISGNGEYVFFTDVKLLASNLLEEIGEFSEFIYASNYDGSIAAGERNLFDGITFDKIEELPFSSKAKFFHNEENLIYMWDDLRSKIIIMGF